MTPNPLTTEAVQLVGIAGSFWEPLLSWSWPVMSLLLGLIDGFNPCAMWTLMILIGFLLSVPSRAVRWGVGGVFIATSALIYAAALLAYWLGFTAVITLLASQTIGLIFRLVGAVGVATGALMIYRAREDAIACKFGSLQKQQTFRRKLNDILQQGSLWLIIPGIMALAISVNALELLCSFAIPTAFTATLVASELPVWSSLLAILIYDLGYIFDDVLVFVIAMKTLKIHHFSSVTTRWAHFLGGGFLVILGGILLWKPSVIMTLF